MSEQPAKHAVWLALHAYEFIWWREARATTRAQQVPALEMGQSG